MHKMRDTLIDVFFELRGGGPLEFALKLSMATYLATLFFTGFFNLPILKSMSFVFAVLYFLNERP